MPKLPPDWRKLFVEAQQLNESRAFLTDWEASFVISILERGTRFPTAKQAVSIARILEKTTRFKPTDADADSDWEDF